MQTRTVAVAAFAATALLVLSGCSLLPSPDPVAEPVNSSTGEDVAPELAEFYHQSLLWEPCAIQRECTTVTAPLDWNSPADGSIELAVIRSIAGEPDDRVGSLLVNPGGPGGSGWDYVAAANFPGISDRFDIVGWDPRGVGRSTPVTCYTNATDRDESLYGTFDNDYGTAGWIDELTASSAEYAAACEAETGELLAHIDTSSTARDLDMLRAVLGDEKLNYLGYSYGTRIGATYAELYPEKVGRMVLDGAIDPLLSDFDMLKAQMVGFERAFSNYLVFCFEREDCPFTGTVDEAKAQAEALIQSAGTAGLTGRDGRVLDEATIGTAIAANLYSKGNWQDMSGMFVDLKAGDPNAAFQHADRYNSRNPDGSYSGNSVDVYQAVTCADGDFADDAASTLDRVTEIDAAAPTIGRFFTYDDFAVLDVLCSHWPVPATPQPTSYEAEGSPTILVIGTSNDPATPYAWAQSLADQLSKGFLVSYEGEGHTIYNQGVRCIDDAVDVFFNTGTVPPKDPKCEDPNIPVEYN